MKGNKDQLDLTYAGVGVNYAAIDPFKLLAQAAARQTVDALTGYDTAHTGEQIPI